MRKWCRRVVCQCLRGEIYQPLHNPVRLTYYHSVVMICRAELRNLRTAFDAFFCLKQSSGAVKRKSPRIDLIIAYWFSLPLQKRRQVSHVNFDIHQASSWCSNHLKLNVPCPLKLSHWISVSFASSFRTYRCWLAFSLSSFKVSTTLDSDSTVAAFFKLHSFRDKDRIQKDCLVDNKKKNIISTMRCCSIFFFVGSETLILLGDFM